MAALIQQDNELKHIYNSCAAKTRADSDYDITNGLLLWKGKIVIPPHEELIQQIMHEFHSSKTGGHAGVTKIVARISAQFHWPKMQHDIRKFVRECRICQQAKVDQALLAGLLQPLPIPQEVWEDIAMDFITNLPSSHGYSTIMGSC